MKKYFLFFLLSLLISLPAFWTLLKPGYYNMHDDLQIIRQFEMEKCFKDGQIPCRWTPDLDYGYGYPLFNFYPPLPYFVGQVFRTFNFSFVWSIKLTAILQIYLTFLTMFLLAYSLSNGWGALLAATLYLYAPYHALNIYVRGAMNEAWAAVFFPLIFYFSRKLILNPTLKSFAFLSLSFSGLLLSHNPMALSLTPFLFVWIIYHLVIKHWPHIKSLSFRKDVFNLFLSSIYGLSLSAFFTLPVLWESHLVQIETMFSDYYHYSAHFTSLFQLFINNFWGEGSSVWGQSDQMSFMIGYCLWIVPIAVASIIFYKAIFKKSFNQNSFLAIITVALGFLAAFLTHQRSELIWWLLPPLQKIQFPWRMLNIAIFFFSLSAAFLFSTIEKRFSLKTLRLLFILLITTVFLTNIFYFHPLTSGPLSDSEKLSGKAWDNQIKGNYDYLPQTALKAAEVPSKDFIDNIIPQQTYKITGAKKGTDWLFFNLTINSQSKITLSQLAFPDFKLFIDSQDRKYTTEPVLGRIVFDLSPGTHQVYLKLYNTPVRSLSNLISFLALVSLPIVFFHKKWNK